MHFLTCKACQCPPQIQIVFLKFRGAYNIRHMLSLMRSAVLLQMTILFCWLDLSSNGRGSHPCHATNSQRYLEQCRASLRQFTICKKWPTAHSPSQVCPEHKTTCFCYTKKFTKEPNECLFKAQPMFALWDEITVVYRTFIFQS